MKYEIDIVDDSDDKFEENADNVAVIKVIDHNGCDMTSVCEVNVFLSKNAMLGLGTELIRLAHNFKEMKHVHLEPCTKEMQVQRMGIFLSPDSSEITIICNDNDVVDNCYE